MSSAIGTALEVVHVGLEAHLGVLRACFISDSLREKLSDADPDQPVGQQIPFKECVDHRVGVRLGSGTKALVRSW